MTRRLIELLSSWAVERRAIILALSLTVALGFGLQLRHLEVDTSPEALVTTIEGHEASAELFKQHFERAESQVLVIVTAPDVTSEGLLSYQYGLHRRLDALPASAQVDGMTHLTLPARLADPPSERELAALVEAQKKRAAGVDVPTDARAEAPAQAEPEAGAEAEGAREKKLDEETLQAIVAGDEDSFPQGLSGLAFQLNESESAPILSGESPSKEELSRYREALLSAEWLRPSLLSADRTASVMVVHFDADEVFNQASKLEALNSIREAVSAQPIPSGAKVLYGGAPVMREVILDKLEKDRDFLNPAMALVCLLVLGITFRWWAAVVAPISAVGIAALFVIGGMAIVGQPLTILTNIIPPLLIIVGLSDSVHLLGRYQEELPRYRSRLGAGRQAARAMLVACFLTSLTTAVGFGSLSTAKTPELQTFGVVAAVGVMAAYFATVFFVPAFITLFPPPLSWTLGRESGQKAKLRVGLIERAVFSVTRLVLRHAKLVVVLTSLSGLALGWAASRVSVDDRLLDIFEEEEETTRVTHLVEDKLSGIRPLEVLLTRKKGSFLAPEELAHVEQVISWAKKDPDIIAANSYVEPLREVRANLTLDPESRTRPFTSTEHVQALLQAVRAGGQEGSLRWVADEGRVARLTIFFKDSGVKRSLELIDELEDRLERGFAHEPSVEISFLGEAYTGSVGRSHVLSDLMSGLGLALAIIFCLLVVLFRSLPLGLVAMPPNVIPLVATGAYMTLRGIPLNLTTVITFSIGIGLAVDDTVHVVARFREERQRVSSLRVALLRAGRGTGRAIVVTAFSLSAGFLVLTQSEFVSVRQFGELIAVTVGNCLLGALLIQPALLFLVSRPRRGHRRKPSSP